MNTNANINIQHRIANKLQAVAGLLLTGAGLSMSVDAGTKREKGKKWFLSGTLALVIFNSGLCLVADSACKK